MVIHELICDVCKKETSFKITTTNIEDFSVRCVNCGTCYILDKKTAGHLKYKKTQINKDGTLKCIS